MKNKLCNQSKWDTVAGELLQPLSAISQVWFHRAHRGLCCHTAPEPHFNLHRIQTPLLAPEEQYFTEKKHLEKTLFPSAPARKYYPLCFGFPPTAASMKFSHFKYFMSPTPASYSWATHATCCKAPFFCLCPKPLKITINTGFQICVLHNAGQGKIHEKSFCLSFQF